MNHLLKIKKLNNRYFAMRHGESTSNACGILISNPKEGIKKYGLTPAGKKKVKANIKVCQALDKNAIIYSSDFLRTKESAQMAKEIIGAASINLEPKLRERFFGKLEHGPADNYHLVWVQDNLNPAQKEYGVESVLEVQDRTTKLIVQLEKQYQHKKILLISHGDPIQILQASFLKQKKINHQIVPMPQRAEIRELTFSSK